jgi:hypothetical protein
MRDDQCIFEQGNPLGKKTLPPCADLWEVSQWTEESQPFTSCFERVQACAIPSLITSEARPVLLRDSPQVQIESPCGACTRESGYQEEIVAAFSNNSQPFVFLRAVCF